MALPQTPEITKTLTYLVEIEVLAQDISNLKESKLELANVQNKLQECLRALQKTQDKRADLRVGALFIEGSTEECKTIVEKEIAKIKDQYETTSQELREKLLKKRDLEYEPQIEGIGLKPLSYAEAKGLMTGFGLQ